MNNGYLLSSPAAMSAARVRRTQRKVGNGREYCGLPPSPQCLQPRPTVQRAQKTPNRIPFSDVHKTLSPRAPQHATHPVHGSVVRCRTGHGRLRRRSLSGPGPGMLGLLRQGTAGLRQGHRCGGRSQGSEERPPGGWRPCLCAFRIRPRKEPWFRLPVYWSPRLVPAIERGTIRAKENT